MTKIIVNEGLDYMDMEHQIEPSVSVDEYSAKMGKDSDIVTLAFIVKSEAAGNDLVDWFERGYDWILDSSLSEGELCPGKYLVFVEMKRRTKVPERIVELLDDLETLTGMTADEWVVNIDEQDYPAKAEILKFVPPEPDNKTDVDESIKRVNSNDSTLTHLNLNNIKVNQKREREGRLILTN